MADRNPLHQQRVGEGGLVPHIKRYELPLLPFERELISIAGITEDEYRFFVAESLKQAQIRPADYKSVPDIQNSTFEIILVNFIIGVALSAASYFLTPKPKAPDLRNQEGGRIDLGNRTGQSVFAPTSGFDSLATLANYNEPIPVLFGLYTGTTGGMLVSPKLVWSRSISLGTEQGVKLMFVVGEQGVGTLGVDRPDLSGIFLGNAPLTAAFSHQFAFYWRSGTFNGTSRIKRNNLRYGTSGRPDTGDPENNDDIFVAPVASNARSEAFCMSYTPTSNSQFGAYSPVCNGTDYRVNWRIVSIPNFNDPQDQLVLERIKIAGAYGIPLDTPANKTLILDKGMSGRGRGYSRRTGIISIGDGFGAFQLGATEARIVPNAAAPADPSITVGTQCVFLIRGADIPFDFYFQANKGEAGKGVKVDDINNELSSQRAAADSILQLGETIQIGATLWRVVGRSASIWEEGKDQRITLECIELLSSRAERARIGLVGPGLFETAVTTAGTTEGGPPKIGTSFFPLTRTQLAVVRNTRPCDATEFGIRSQVWNRANGLCNFSAIPGPLTQLESDRAGVTVNSGTMSMYFARTSVFEMQIRLAGNGANGLPNPWATVPVAFCVTGNQPTDMYNYIRVEHPSQQQYEYRFVPCPGADVLENFPATQQLWRLDARRAGQTGAIFKELLTVGSYGRFGIAIAGDKVSINNIRANPEMSAEIRVSGTAPVTTTKPLSIFVAGWNPSATFSAAVLEQAYAYHVLGGTFGGRLIGQSYSVNVTYTVGTKTIQATWSGTIRFNNDTVTFPTLTRVWGDITVVMVANSATGAWTLGEQFDVGVTATASNPLQATLGTTVFGPKIQIGSVETTTTPGTPESVTQRIFEGSSQLSDVSFYGNLLQKSNESAPEHTISYVNEVIKNDAIPNYTNMVTAGLALKASKTYSSIDQIRVWKDDGIPVQRFGPQPYATGDSNAIGPSNLFCDLVYYLLTDKVAGAGASISPAQIKTADFTETAKFLRANKLFFDGAISEPTNIRQYITQVAPFFLCNFVIADGLFSLVPALPTTSSGAISNAAVPISALFTDGNILEGTFGVEYINSEERNNIQAVIRYRQGVINQLPEERTLTVRWNETGAVDNKIESFDMTQYCTSRDHALLVGKYLLSVRRRITHTIKFKTTPQGLSLAPGKYIRVITQVSPYSGANNGVISDTGAITSVTPLANGSYSVIYYKPPATEVATGTLTVSNGTTTQSAFYGSVFTVTNSSTQSNVYVIEQLSFDENGMVEIAASEFPTDSSLRSVIAQDVLSTTAFATES